MDWNSDILLPKIMTLYVHWNARISAKVIGHLGTVFSSSTIAEYKIEYFPYYIVCERE